MSSRVLYAGISAALLAMLGCDTCSSPCGIIVDSTGAERFRCKCTPIATDTEFNDKIYRTLIEKIERRLDNRPGERIRRLVVDGKCEAITVAPDGGRVCLAISTESECKIVVVESRRAAEDESDECTVTQDMFRVTHEWSFARNDSDVRIHRMDTSRDSLAILWSDPRRAIRIYSRDDGKLLATCNPCPGGFDVDLRLSPDGSLVALYGHYLVRQFPQAIDLFWPYSQKPKGYLAIWRVRDGTLVKEVRDGVFIPELPWDDLRIKRNNAGRSFRISKPLEIGWVGSGAAQQVVLPDGSLINVNPRK